MARETFYGAMSLQFLRAAMLYWTRGQYRYANWALRNSLSAQAKINGDEEFHQWVDRWLGFPWAGYFPHRAEG